MESFNGVKWGELSNHDKKHFLMIGHVFGDIKEGACIIDFNGVLSINATIVKHIYIDSIEYDIIVNDDEAFYISE